MGAKCGQRCPQGDAASVTSAAVLRRRIAKFNLNGPAGDYLKEENIAHPPK
jgi:hypothetical protein